MSKICNQCGKTVEGEGVAFCPYCGAKLPEKAAEQEPENREPVDAEAEKWIQKALGVSSYPERKKILQKGLEACPGNREIEWELLFVGEEPPKRTKVFDYSIIRSWILEIYRNPGIFTEERRDSMRSRLFDAPQLKACLARFDDPEKKQQEYLDRLCREYIELFLEGDNQVMGVLFGFRLDRNKEKRLAAPVAEMIARMKADEKLSPQQREQLWKTFYQAYGARAGGKMEHLDALLNE